MRKTSHAPRLRTLDQAFGRRRLLAGVGGAALAPHVATVARPLAALAQESDARGVPDSLVGQNAIEFVATIHQRGFEFDMYGYVTRVAGIERGLLFSNPDPTDRGADGARLTLTGSATGSSRSILEPIFNVNAEGSISFSFSDAGGATFDDPASFAAGEEVAIASTRIQSIIAVTAPQTGLNNAYGDVIVGNSAPFSIGDVAFQFSVTGTPLRLDYTGLGTLLDPDLPESVTIVSGNMSRVT